MLKKLLVVDFAIIKDHQQGDISLFFRGWLANALLTSCSDGVSRVWIESLASEFSNSSQNVEPTSRQQDYELSPGPSNSTSEDEVGSELPVMASDFLNLTSQLSPA